VHLNELQEKFGPKGLSIIAVTDEGESDTVKWVENKGAQYPYAYDKGGKLARHFGVRGIPDAVLIDATGKVAWRGHPAALDEKTLEAALTGALPKALYDWSPAAKVVKGAFLKRAYKSAIELAEGLPEGEGGAEIAAALRTLVTSRVANMKAAHARGDFLGARNEAAELSKDLAGMPELESATQVLADITADKEAALVIKGQEKVAKIRSSGLSKRKEVEAAIESLQKLVKEHTGTFVEKEANDLIRQLREREN